MCWEGFLFCMYVFVFLISCFCLSVYVLMHCSIFFFRLCVCFFFCFLFPFFVSVCLCFAFSSLYRSLNILFVVLLITGCFCLRSRVNSPQQKCCFVGDFLFCLLCGWCLFLWPSDAVAFTACVFVCSMWVLFTHSLSFKYLDQRVGFSSLLFNDFLLFCLECKSSRVFLFCSYLSTSFSLFLCYFCFNLSGCLFSLKLTC